MTVLKYILLSLAIAVCLFFSMLKRFGWAHYHRWTFFITKTEAKLSGQWLDKYLHYHSGMYFVMALFFLLYFFQAFHSALRFINLNFCLFQKINKHHTIDCIIIHNKYMCIGCRK